MQFTRILLRPLHFTGLELSFWLHYAKYATYNLATYFPLIYSHRGQVLNPVWSLCLAFYTAFGTLAACCIYVLPYFPNLLCSLFVLFCITKIQLIFDTPKFFSSFLSKNLTFFLFKGIYSKMNVALYTIHTKLKKPNQYFKVLSFSYSYRIYHLDTTKIGILFYTAKYLGTFFSIKHTFNFYYTIRLFFTYFEYFNYTHTPILTLLSINFY